MSRTSDAIRQPSLLHSSAVLTVAFGILNVSSWLYHVVMSRWLGPADYGALSTLLAAVTVFIVLMNTVQMALSAQVARLQVTADDASVHSTIRHTFRRFFRLGTILMILLIFLSPWLSRAINLATIAPVVVAATVPLWWALLPVIRGALQGRAEFYPLGVSLAVEGGLKLILGSALVVAGWGLSGGIAGVSLGALGALIVGIIRHPSWVWRGAVRDGDLLVQQYWLVPYLVALGCVAVLTQADVVVVRMLARTPQDAGLFAAASNAARVILYLTAALPVVMVPELARRRAWGRDTLPVLRRAVIYTAAAAAAVTVILSAVPHLVIAVMFGRAYLAAAPLLRLLSLAMLLHVVSLIGIYHRLSRHDFGILLPLAVLTAMFPLALWALGGRPLPVAMADIAFAVAALATVFLWPPTVDSRDSAFPRT